MLALAPPLAAQVKVSRMPDRIAVEIGGKPYTALYFGPPKPYLHPLRAASGTIVTRLFPMETTPGEPRDHPHHRGLWLGHGDVNGYDFWTNEPGQRGAKKGRIVLGKVLKIRSGARSGLLAARFEWQDSEGRGLLADTRKMTFRAQGPLRVIDVEIDLTALQAVTFADTKEGAFGLRVAPWLEEAGQRVPPGGPAPAGTIVNAEGASGESSAWGRRSAWLDYSGEVGGEKLGVAILDHPGNPRHPTYWHARGYGLMAANIFGAREFEGDKSKDGSLRLERGRRLRFRYRVVVHPGDAASAGIARLYREYAKGRR